MKSRIFVLLTTLLATCVLTGTALAEDRWYQPIEADATLAPQPPPAPPAPARKNEAFSLQMPIYNWFNGGLRGVGTSYRLRYDANGAGFFLGIYAPGGWVDAGVDLNFLGGAGPMKMGPVDIWALYPTIGLRGMTQFEDLLIGLPLTLTGVRVTTCDPLCIVADVRGPTFDVLVNPDQGTAAVALGAALSVGLGF